MRERREADVRLALVGLAVRELVDEVRELCRVASASGGTQLVAELELQVGDDRAEVGVAAALAEAVDGALHLHRARLDAGERVRDRELGVVVAVDAERRPATAGARRASTAPRRRRQRCRRGCRRGRAAWRPLRPRREARERVLGVGAPAVEEVLGVEDHLVDALLQVRDRVGDDLEVGLERDAQIVRDGTSQVGRRSSRPGSRRRAASRRFWSASQVTPWRRVEPKAATLACRSFSFAHGLEERRVARVRARPAALDVVDAEGVEPLGDAQLVLEREGDVLALAPVAERRVVELDRASCGRTALPPMKASCSTRTASSTYFASTTTEILISEVEIIWMLMLDVGERLGTSAPRRRHGCACRARRSRPWRCRSSVRDALGADLARELLDELHALARSRPSAR